MAQLVEHLPSKHKFKPQYCQNNSTQLSTLYLNVNLVSKLVLTGPSLSGHGLWHLVLFCPFFCFFVLLSVYWPCFRECNVLVYRTIEVEKHWCSLIICNPKHQNPKYSKIWVFLSTNMRPLVKIPHLISCDGW
jgi:hypothetical protein